MKNSKYTTFKEIFARVASVIKTKDINPADVLEWAIECETEWIQSFPSLVPYHKIKLNVRDKTARIPPYCARVLDVYKDPGNQKSHVNFYNNGAYLILDSSYDLPFVYINFMGIAIDEESQTPLIMKGHEEACVQHVIVKLFYEDFITGKLSPTAYGEMKEERNLQVRAAQGGFSNYSRQELMELAAINMNMLPYIRYESFAHRGIGG